MDGREGIGRGEGGIRGGHGRATKMETEKRGRGGV